MAWVGPVSLVDLLKDETGEGVDYGKKAEAWGVQCNSIATGRMEGWKRTNGVYPLLEVPCSKASGSERLHIAKPIL